MQIKDVQLIGITTTLVGQAGTSRLSLSNRYVESLEFDGELLIAKNTSGGVRIFGPSAIGEMTPADPESEEKEPLNAQKAAGNRKGWRPKKGKPKGK